MGNDKDQNFEDLNISPLQSAAYSLHEMYKSFRTAGFTRAEALKLVSDIATSSINNNGN